MEDIVDLWGVGAMSVPTGWLLICLNAPLVPYSFLFFSFNLAAQPGPQLSIWKRKQAGYTHGVSSAPILKRSLPRWYVGVGAMWMWVL